MTESAWERRCQETRQLSSCQVSQGRLSRRFHPSGRIVPYPRKKKNASLFGNPYFLFSLYGFSITWPGVFQNTGDFLLRVPGFSRQGCLSRCLPRRRLSRGKSAVLRHLCLGVGVLLFGGSIGGDGGGDGAPQFRVVCFR